jgi:hypothetical protein
MIRAQIVLDSINPIGKRITTWMLTYPRSIHSEFMTHRVFSRNAASSRAIPTNKMIEAIQLQPAMPNRYGTLAKGMGDAGIMECKDQMMAQQSILELRDQAIATVESLQSLNASKQLINRYLEPWMHMTVLATATDHRNFFALRAHPAAEPNFQELAYCMLECYLDSDPVFVDWGDWHLPGRSHATDEGLTNEGLLKVCTARACRASYVRFDEELTFEDAVRIHDTAKENGHMSPFEHCAQAVQYDEYEYSNFDTPGFSGPSYWRQYRKFFPGENRTTVDLNEIRRNRPEWISIEGKCMIPYQGVQGL